MRPQVLLCASLVAFLAACDGGGSPPVREALPYGADRQIGATGRLPPPPTNRPHDASIAPTDDTRGVRVGSVVSGRGGQKAQKENEERAEQEARRGRQREQEPSPQGTEAMPPPTQ